VHTLSVLTERQELVLAASSGADIVISVFSDYNISEFVSFFKKTHQEINNDVLYLYVLTTCITACLLPLYAAMYATAWHIYMADIPLYATICHTHMW